MFALGLGCLIPCGDMVSVDGASVPRQMGMVGVRGYTAGKDDYLRRLRRIEGQVRGLERMVESDEYCIDILTQVSAATRALESVALGLLEEHLGHCVTL